MNPLPLDREPQYMLMVTHQQAIWHTHQHHNCSKAGHQDQKMGSGPIPRNPRPFPEIAGWILPLISLWDDPAPKNYPRHILEPLSTPEMARTLSVEWVPL